MTAAVLGAAEPGRTGRARMTTRVIQLLDVDPDLAERMPPVARREAEAVIRARVFRVAKGPWQPPDIDHGAMGLLILGGLMVRRLHLGTAASAEIVGPSDIIRPWETDLIPALMPSLSDWTVLDEAQVALLDGHVTALIGRYPELMAAVGGRLLRRSRSLAFLMAAQHFLRVEDRLLATLWHLASMWGKVTPAGTLVPFRLTHAMLADIVGAQRPTTTMALRSLIRQGLLERTDARSYVLIGAAPDWKREGRPVAELEV
jgi:CRP/FNR family transcriptional regulator, cyclic AMP receptor protein